jgi:hypothetical protein
VSTRKKEKEIVFCFELFFFVCSHTIQDHDTPEGRFSLRSKELGLGLLFVERFKEKQDKPFSGVATHIGGQLSTGRQDSPCRRGEQHVLYE